jgi:hypothetical protein
MRRTKHDKGTGEFVRQLDYDKIAKLYSGGKSFSEISHILKCSSTAIAYALKQMDIKTRGKHAKRRKKA